MGVVDNRILEKLLEWMETTTAQPRGGDERAGLEVSLMVYDLKGECNSMAFPDRWAARVDALVALVNACASPCGLGVFHSGVAVGGREYAYGYCPEGSGVYTTAPGENPMYVFRAAVPLGSVALAPRELDARLRALRARWAGDGYDLLQRNCNHFAEDMARELGCEQLPPGYVNRLARAGDSASEAVSAATSHPLTVQLVNSPISCSVCTAWTRARQEGIVHGGAAVASELARGAVRTVGRWCAGGFAVASRDIRHALGAVPKMD